MKNPMEECPPDEPIEKFTISLEYDNKTQKWSAYCREWKCEVYRDTATEAAAVITEDIDKHNDESFQALLNEVIDKNPGAIINAMGRYAAKQMKKDKPNRWIGNTICEATAMEPRNERSGYLGWNM